MSYLRKEQLRKWLPTPVFKILSYSNVYRQRVSTWIRIIVLVRGRTFIDEGKLLLSALFGLFTSMRKLSEWQDPNLLWNATFFVRNVGYFLVRKDTDDLHHINPYRELAVFDTIKKILSKGDLFIDAGANIGFYSVLAAKQVGPTGKVVAVEMLPKNAERLSENVELNKLKNVEIIKKALSDKNGDKISISNPKEKFGRASIIKYIGDSDRSVTVETIRLDTLVDAGKQVKLFKIDTEGAEKLVLNGAENILDNIQNIIFEMYDNDKNRENVFEILKSNNYQVNRLGGKDYIAVRE